MANHKSKRLYPALLKYWRARCGMSQMDLAFAAGVSARHISFLETGRSQPSRHMALCLAATMDLPLRAQNEMLIAAGFSAAFSSTLLDDKEQDPGVLTALDLMLERHEPFPVFVMNARFDIVRTNRSAWRFLQIICAEPPVPGSTPNGYLVFLHPKLARSSMQDWPRAAALLVGLLHRKVLRSPDNTVLNELLDEVLDLPDIDPQWRAPDLDTPATGVFTFHFKTSDFTGAFLTTLTTFIAPNNITVEELSIESYYPLDEHTTRQCEQILTVAR